MIYTYATVGYAPTFMELTLEAYRSIVKNVGNRADIATLCGVSHGFRRVAERALYNTLFMQNDTETVLLCNTLTTSPRLAALVDALTIVLADRHDSSDSDHDGSGDEESATGQPAMDWQSIHGALVCTTQLRYFNVHINDGSSTSTAWVLEGCQFKLRKFHCDFDWDIFLVNFLSGQPELEDLYILDYRDEVTAEISTSRVSRSPLRSLALAPDDIPKLTTLECTFSEAAVAIVPGRPVSHLKTCFSRTEPIAKRIEMRALLSKVKLSTVPLVSLDLADSSYADKFSSELLASISSTKELMCELRHAGTFVLPVDGREVSSVPYATREAC